jgi:hypothetical protein
VRPLHTPRPDGWSAGQRQHGAGEAGSAPAACHSAATPAARGGRAGADAAAPAGAARQGRMLHARGVLQGPCSAAPLRTDVDEAPVVLEAPASAAARLLALLLRRDLGGLAAHLTGTGERAVDLSCGAAERDGMTGSGVLRPPGYPGHRGAADACAPESGPTHPWLLAGAGRLEQAEQEGGIRRAGDCDLVGARVFQVASEQLPHDIIDALPRSPHGSPPRPAAPSARPAHRSPGDGARARRIHAASQADGTHRAAPPHPPPLSPAPRSTSTAACAAARAGSVASAATGAASVGHPS